MIRAFLSRLIRHTPLRWHVSNKISRLDLIQHAIDAIGAVRYLEIGVAEGRCFCGVRVAERIGVDPIAAAPAVVAQLAAPGGTYVSLTSDIFFSREAPRLLAHGVDVVFIDGLHTYDQSYRDCVNALRYLKPGGVIFMHDCLPISAAEACAAPSYDEAIRLNGPGWSGLWTGDGWKAIVALRSLHTDVEACVLDCDHGVGMVWRRSARRALGYTADQIAAMSYDDLVRDRTRLLGLRPPQYLLDTASQLAGEREKVSCAS
jgi:hypothetical protein